MEIEKNAVSADTDTVSMSGDQSQVELNLTSKNKHGQLNPNRGVVSSCAVRNVAEFFIFSSMFSNHERN